jgi:hypothetical protein
MVEAMTVIHSFSPSRRENVHAGVRRPGSGNLLLARDWR